MFGLSHLPTETLNPASERLDKLSISEILDLIHAADREAVDSVGRVLPQIASVCTGSS